MRHNCRRRARGRCMVDTGFGADKLNEQLLDVGLWLVECKYLTKQSQHAAGPAPHSHQFS
jgi:hypothetical protein